MSIGAIDLVEPYVIFSAPRGTFRSLPSARLTSDAVPCRSNGARLPVSSLGHLYALSDSSHSGEKYEATQPRRLAGQSTDIALQRTVSVCVGTAA